MTVRVHQSVNTWLLVLVTFLGADPRVALAQVASASSTTLPTVTAADYARAESFLAAAVNPLVIGGTVNASWLPDDRFSYRLTTSEGTEFILIDPTKRTRAPAFDHQKLAATLSKSAGRTVDPKRLPFQSIDLSPDGASVAFDMDRLRWSCDVNGAACSSKARARVDNGLVSPDGTRVVFVRDWNLWIRDLASNVERPLTTDGVANFGYATDNAGWKTSDRPIGLWSPDSKKVATFQQDERLVGDMYLVDTTRIGHPSLKAWKYPLPGDTVVAMLYRVVIDTDTGVTTRFHMAPDYHRAMLGDDVSTRDMIWSPDASQLAFVSTSRDHKTATVCVADARSGSVRTVFAESEQTHFEAPAGWRVLWATRATKCSCARSPSRP